MNLKNCDILQIPNFHAIKIKNKFFVNNNIDGNWVLVNKEEYNILKLLKQPLIFKKLKEQLNSLEILDKLYDVGMLKINNSKKFIPKNLILTKYPFHLVLNVTDRCNLICEYCYVNSNKNKKTITLNKAHKILKELINLPNERVHILFHGGEPLLEIDLIEKLYNYAKTEVKKLNKHITFSIQSNGTIFNDQILEFLKNKDVKFSISFDVDKNTQNKLRKTISGKGSYNQVIKTLEKLSKNNIHPHVNVVVSKDNYKKIDNFFSIFKKYNITSFALNPLFGFGRSKVGISELYYFICMKKLLEKLIAYNKTTDNKIYERNINFLVKNLINLDYSYMCLSSPCGAGVATLSIDPEGNIFPCDELVGCSEFFCGNIDNKNLRGVLKRAPIKKCKARTIKNIKECKSCIWAHYCTAGCLSKSYHFNCSSCSKSNLCNYYKKMLKYLLYLVCIEKINLNLISKSEKNEK